MKIYQQSGESRDSDEGFQLLDIRNLRPIEANVLATLLINQGEIVSSKKLQQSGTYSDRAITDNNIRQAIYSLRAALNDVSIPHQIIKNKPRLGYSIQGATTVESARQSREITENKDSIELATPPLENALAPAIDKFHESISREKEFGSTKFDQKRLRYCFTVLLFILIGGFIYLCYCYQQYQKEEMVLLDSYSEQITPQTRLIILTTTDITQEAKNNISILKELLKGERSGLAKDEKMLNVIFYQLRKDITIKCISYEPELTLTSVNLTSDDFSSKLFTGKVLEDCINHAY